MSDTPRTDAMEYYFLNHDSCAGESIYTVIGDNDVTWVKGFEGYSTPSDFSRQLERELAEALEWKRYLSSWGGTPEIVYSFIQGQEARISAAQKVEKQRDALIEGLEKLASCDWVITLPDRMDAVREIARQTLQIVKNNKL